MSSRHMDTRKIGYEKAEVDLTGISTIFYYLQVEGLI